MKKVLLGVVAGSLIFAGSAFAGQGQQNAGCGLGAQALGDSKWSNETLIGNLVFTFLNNITANQTFGITSGTSQCKAPSKIVENERLKEFVVANMDNLAKDIAEGRGESLDTLSELINIPAEKRTEVYARLQSNFSNIFTSEKVEVADVIDNIVTVING